MTTPLLRELAVLCLAAGTLGYQATALAWGDRGHRIIAAIAYDRLVPEARKEADALLAEDQGDKRTAPDFVSRATWADALLLQDRKTPSKTFYNGTRFWHFAEFEIERGSLERACYGFRPLPAGRPASSGAAKDCVLSKVEQFAAELANPATERKEKILALKFLIHFVGDLHQPLHVAQDDDLFGSELNVRSNANPKMPTVDLHEYWDNELVIRALAGPGETDVAAARRIAFMVPPDRMYAVHSGSPREWMLETVDVARHVVYDLSGQSKLSDGRRGNVLYLDFTYDERAVAAVRELLAKAGFRLALMLNEALAPTQPAPRK